MILKNNIINMVRPESEFWGCGIIIINKNKEILLGLRADNLQWGLPGGKIEINETALEGIYREVKEETNLDIKNVEFIDIQNEFDKKDFMFFCDLFEGELKPQEGEVLEFKWVSQDTVLNLNLFKESIDTLQHANKKRLIKL